MPPPSVTGISPNEGPPGTRIKIRGENFGSSPLDLTALTILGIDCLLTSEWKSNNLIIALSPAGKDEKGEIIVTTRHGGKGTCTVHFRGYRENVGPLKESAVWVNDRERTISPSALQQDDPLGLSVEGAERKYPEKYLKELFPEKSGDLMQENYEAAYFLLENHHATTFDDLKAGLSFLRRKVGSQKEGQLSFLKANVSSIVDQMDTLKGLKTRFENDKKVYGTDPTKGIEEKIKSAKTEADKMFYDVLGRKDTADSTRNALNVLNRFKFLFNLPVNIQRNIEKGDYDKVIDEYSRAKHLYSGDDYAVFQPYLEEIDQQIINLQKLLNNKLKEMPLSLDEQKKLIRNLVNLETPGDPAWSSIDNQHQFIFNLLEKCKDDHQTHDQATEKLSILSTPSSSKYVKHSNNQEMDQIPQKVLFIDDLTNKLSTAFPDLWKLGQAYFMGELHITPDTTKHTQFKHMVLGIIQFFSNLARAAIIPDTLDLDIRADYGIWQAYTADQIGPWLPHCINHIRDCYTSLINLDLPSDALDIIKDLLFDTRVQCLRTIFQNVLQEIGSLHKKETWEYEMCDEFGALTSLPSMLEKIVEDSLQHVRDIVFNCEDREDVPLHSNSVKKDIATIIENILTSFAFTLEHAAVEDYDEPATEDFPSSNERLLLCLSNCYYAKNYSLPRIENSLKSLDYPPMPNVFANCNSQYKKLESKLFEVYLELKCDTIVGIIEHDMYVGNFDWARSVKPTGPRDYVKHLLLNLSCVHAEMRIMCVTFLPSIMSRLVETVTEELNRLFSCIQRMNCAGCVQAWLDLTCLEQALLPYLDGVAGSHMADSFKPLTKLEKHSDKKILDMGLSTFKTQMRMQLNCFLSK